MANLETRYVGLTVRSPLLTAAAATTETVKRMKKCEKAGAGAVVMKSLFEDPITRRSPTPRFKMLRRGSGKESTYTLYSYEQASTMNPQQYADEIQRAKDVLQIPVIASINCFSESGWTSYAQAVEKAGADALELNVSCAHSSILFAGEDVEERMIEVVRRVRPAVSIPIVPKISGQLTSPLKVAQALEEAGANGVVVFNRMTGLDVNVEDEKPILHGGHAGHGGPWSLHYNLRWVAALFPKVHIDISATGGVAEAEDVMKYLLAGATTVQVCTLIYLQGYEILKRLTEGLHRLMDAKGYETIDDFRGRAAGRILSADEVIRDQTVIARIDQKKCTACGRCHRVCLYGAVSRRQASFRITSRCTGCGLCAELCPASAIDMVPL